MTSLNKIEKKHSQNHISDWYDELNDVITTLFTATCIPNNSYQQQSLGIALGGLKTRCDHLQKELPSSYSLHQHIQIQIRWYK